MFSNNPSVAAVAVVLLLSMPAVVESCLCNTTHVVEALESFFTAATTSCTTETPTRVISWKRGDPDTLWSVCLWDGVFCCSDFAVAIDLQHAGLCGTLASELSTIPVCRLELQGNQLHGTIPREYSSWGNAMTVFDMSSNVLSGVLPISFQNWTQLETFVVSKNNLSGALPDEYAAWTSLASFEATQNKLTGTLPPQYSQWGSSCSRFDVSSNRLHGTLPKSYSNLTSVRLFRVNQNSLTGTLPEEYMRWSGRITNIHFGDNGFVGPLPDVYRKWTNMNRFRANSNRFNGTLPESYAAWNQLQTFNVNNNSLGGTLPEAYGGSWWRIIDISVAYNNFNSTIPTSYFQYASNMEKFFASWNLLTGTIPKFPQSLTYLAVDNNNFSDVGGFPSSSTSRKWLYAFHNNSLLTVGDIPCQKHYVSVCNTSFYAYRCAAPVFNTFCSDIASLLIADDTDAEEAESNLQRLLSMLQPSTTIPAPPILPLTMSQQPMPSQVPRHHLATASLRYLSSSSSMVASALGSTTAAASIRRLALWPRCGTTSRALMRSGVDVTDAPLQLSIGDAGGAAHRGAVVGNVVVVALCGVAACGAACCHAAWSARSTGRQRGRRHGVLSMLTASMAALRLPGALCAVVASLYQPTLLSALLLVGGESPGGWGAGDACLGAAGCCACAGWVGALCWLLVLRFRAVAGRAGVVAGGGADGARWRRWLSWAVAARVEWRSERGAALFVERFGMVFRGSAAGRQWWAVGDACVTTLLCVVVSLVPASEAACVAVEWVVTSVAALWLAATVVLRPKHRRAALASTVTVNGVCVAVCLCRVLGAPAPVVDALTVVGSVVSVAAIVLVIAGGRLLEWRSTEREELTCGAAASERRPASDKRAPQATAVRAVPAKCERLRAPQAPVSEAAIEKLRSIVELICDSRPHGCRSSI